MTDVLEEDLATWIQANGGWVRHIYVMKNKNITIT